RVFVSRVAPSQWQYSRIIEVEAYGTAVTSAVNVALAGNGGTASASSFAGSAYAPSGAINGERRGVNFGAGGGWNDNTLGVSPDWLQIDFNGVKSISEIDVFTLQDDYTNPQEPTEAMTFSLYGIVDFEVQYWNGSSWITVPGGSVTNNNKVWRKFAFSPISTSSIRVFVSRVAPSQWQYSRIIEVEAYTAP
nr:hypothetical protein [Burkholderiales bacterium]